MKTLAFLLGFAISLPAVAKESCVIKQTSQMVSQRKVSAVTDLVKTKTPNRCQVRFKINVDGEWHTVNWTQDGLWQEEILCADAVRHGTNDLLVRLPGVYKTETITVCSDKPKILTKGYEGLETEFGVDRSKFKGYFRAGHAAKCRFFKGFYDNGKELPDGGVICLNNNELWTVIDKF